MIERYIIYHQEKSGVVRHVTIYSSHRQKAKQMFLKKHPNSKIINIHLV
ncbi:hypothetical protein LCL89_05000 [Halobacillus yeomjeoni]|uniref:Uncharacterized protein n=1 Tax=Halobacillus yeomjeoni TaxID=311194 RepID=A0A931HTD0_9BACI|nr:hypothetical protein [Halobacillus yeomjeoni]MBH0229194.1 hypothetical protein [Halobacillus yeomjeoni]MCA0983408.1 hypothetical protein [Halobacillus yeomjeoni]